MRKNALVLNLPSSVWPFFLWPCLLAGLVLLGACSEEDDTPPPPPQTATGPVAPNTPQAPPGQVMVTVVANSTPAGATVVGGGRQLGTTPLQTQVPIPAPVAGQVQTFAFNFELAGYQPATINAAPVNNTITITAALAPATAPQEVATPDEDEDGDDEDDANEIRVAGRGGGAIFDRHTTRGAAVVGQSCTIDRLRVRLRGNHTFNRDLRITLTDPQGRTYTLQNSSTRNPFRTYTVRRAAGREARGQWNLAIADTLDQDSGRLTGWNMSLRCR
ncbi:MAG: hypothetical protein SangKO_094870 [Sandaracinaceae bacterium]|nr:hypothetical protein [Myxococcales bacterium]